MTHPRVFFHFLLLSTLIFILLSALCLASPIRTVEATVTKISDGDTIQMITQEGTKLKIRLYGIEPPR